MTLRDARMYEFLDRLTASRSRACATSAASARARRRARQLLVGVREQIIFPEIDYDSIDQVRGLDITFTTTAKSDEEAFALLLAFGMPFQAEGRPGLATRRRRKPPRKSGARTRRA